MWYQMVKASCMVVFRDDETYEPTAEMLSRERGTDYLMWGSCDFTPVDIW